MFRRTSTRKIGLWVMILSLLAGFAGFGIFSYKIYAANLTAGPLSISFSGDQLFNETNMYPGKTVVKDLIITNNGTLSHSFSIAANSVSGALASVLQIEPRDGGVPIWNETLANLASLPNGSKVVLSSINAGETKNLQIAAIFPAISGNEYQGQTTVSFDFVFGNESTDQPEPVNNPSPPPAIGFVQDLIAAISPSSPSRNQPSSNVVAVTDNQPKSDVADNNNKTEEISQGVAKGAETKAKTLCFWWLILLLVLIVFLYFYNRFGKSRKIPLFWFWPLLVAVGLYFLQNYFDQFYLETILCRYFWLLEIVVLSIYYLLEFHPRFKKGKE